MIKVVYQGFFTYVEIDDFSNFFRGPTKIKNQNMYHEKIIQN